MSHLDKLQNLADSCSDIRMAIREKDITRGQGAISTLDDDIRALNPKNVVTKIYKDNTTGEYGIVQYGISDSLTQIGTNAGGELAITNIPNGTSLVAVIYPEQIINVAGGTFNGSTNLQYINLENIQVFGDRAFLNADLHGELNLVNATSVVNYCFSGNSHITSVNLPKVTTLTGSSYADGGAFTRCYSLKSANLNDALTSIGNRCFSECSSLGSFTVPSAITKIWSYAFYHCSSLATTLVCPNLVEIERDAFNAAGVIDDINCPNLTTFGYNAFWSSGVKKITNLGSITTLGGGSNSGTSGAFAKCLSLQTVNLPSTLTTIGEGNFYGCTALTSVNFNNAACLIDRGAFRGCTSLATIPGHSNIYQLNDSSFYDCTALAVNINMPNLTSIADSSFRNAGITGVTSLGSITTLPGSNQTGVFRNCTALTTVTLPSTLTTIGNYTFYGCSALTTINIPQSVTAVNQYAFNNCANAEIDLNCPNLTTLGNSCFSGSGIVSITNLGNMTTVPGGSDAYRAFNNCTSLRTVRLPSTITSIGNLAFNGCSALETFVLLSTTPPTIATGASSPWANTNSTFKFYVPYSADHSILSTYTSETNWSSFASRIYELNQDGTVPTT